MSLLDPGKDFFSVPILVWYRVAWKFNYKASPSSTQNPRESESGVGTARRATASSSSTQLQQLLGNTGRPHVHTFIVHTFISPQLPLAALAWAADTGEGWSPDLAVYRTSPSGLKVGVPGKQKKKAP